MSEFVKQNWLIVKTGENSSKGFNWPFASPPSIGDKIDIVDLDGAEIQIVPVSVEWSIDFKDNYQSFRINCDISSKLPDTG